MSKQADRTFDPNFIDKQTQDYILLLEQRIGGKKTKKIQNLPLLFHDETNKKEVTFGLIQKNRKSIGNKQLDDYSNEFRDSLKFIS